MGPPDKREPKVSSSIFDQPYQGISTPSDSSMTNQILSIQSNIEKPSTSNERSLVTGDEDGDRNLNQARSIKESISARSEVKIPPLALGKV